MRQQVAISLGALGDFLLTLPLLRELSQRSPVAVIARSAYRALCPDWLADRPFLAVDGTTGTQLFTPNARFSSPLAETVAGAVAQVFAAEDDLLRTNLLRHGAHRVVFHDPRPPKPPHIVQRFFAAADIVPPAGWPSSPTMPAAPAGDALWIHAGSGSPAKSLPLPFLARRAQCWRAETGLPVVISFGEADLMLRGPLRDAFAGAGTIYEELVCPSLGELRAALARRAKRYLGADTGVTHLAAALGKEVLVGFRTTDPDIWQPIGNCRVLRPDELTH